MFLISFTLFTALWTIFEQRTISYTVGIISIVGALLWWYKKRNRKPFLCILGAFILAASSYFFYTRRNYKPVSSSVFIQNGYVTDNLGQDKYLFKTQSGIFLLYGKNPHQEGDTLWLVGRTRQAKEFTGYQGIESLLYSGFNQQKWLKMKGYVNSLYEDNSILLPGQVSGNILTKARSFLRTQLIQSYTQKQTAALGLGMLIGDTTLFSKENRQSFIDSGLVHIVAVSGGNIVMLVTFLMMILFFIPFYPRIIFILLCVIGYGAICGMDSSVVRAVIMGGLSLTALFLGKSTSSLRLLSIAYGAMLCFNPYFLLYDVGFLLSFGAVVGILFFSDATIQEQNNLQKKEENSSNRFKKMLYGFRSHYLKPSIGATLGIFPISIFFMGKINLLGVIGNLFVVPLIPFIMIGSLVGVCISKLIGSWVLLIEDWLVNWIFIVAKYVANHGIYLLVENIRIKYSIVIVSCCIIFGHYIWSGRHKSSSTYKDQRQERVDKIVFMFENDKQ